MLDPSDLFGLCFVHDCVCAPSGGAVAYTVSKVEDGLNERRVVYVAVGDVITQLPYGGDARLPTFSPSSDTIAFIADGSLRLFDRSLETVSEPLTSPRLKVAEAPQWRPDGNALALVLSEHTDPEGPITEREFRADGIGLLSARRQTIFILDLATRALAAMVNSSLRTCSRPRWDPSGRKLLFLGTDAAIPFASYSPRLFVAEPNLPAREVAGDEWYLTAAEWLPDGRIALAGAWRSTLVMPINRLWVMNADGTDAEARTEDDHGHIGLRIHHDMPIWDLADAAAFVIADTDTAFISLHRRGSTEIWRVTLRGPLHAEPLLTGDRSCLVASVCHATRELLVAITDIYAPPELWLVASDSGEARRLTALNDELLGEWPSLSVTPMRVASDGRQLDAWFIAADGATSPLPTILFIHGGPFIATGHAYRYDFHLLASRGFGVLLLNFRGSAGYGDAFARTLVGDRSAAFPDYMAAIEDAVAAGLADGERLGVWGASHGGYATAWVVGHTARFKAAIVEAGFVNFETMYFLSDAPDSFVRELGGTPYDIPETYRQLSPLSYARSVTTPTMLVHGEQDLRCPISEAEQFFRVLKDHGCQTALMRIPGCSHLGDALGPPPARQIQNAALVGWFEKHLLA